MMAEKKEYSLQDAIADAIKQREAAGELPMQKNPDQQKELAAIAAHDAPKTAEQRHEAIVAAIRTVYDPELPVNLYDLGLIYAINLGENGKVDIDMTLTAPGCPVAGEMPRMVEYAVRHVPGVSEVKATLVWNPPWNKSMMTEAAQLELGFM